MADLAAKQTDKDILKLEKQIHSVFSEAQKDIEAKMQDFNKRWEAKEAIHRKELDEGKITKEQFDWWRKGQEFQSKQWEAKRDQIVHTINNANRVAVNMINGQTTNIFTYNANYISYSMEHNTGVNFGFGLFNNASVARLIKDNPQMLPKWKIDKAKDYRWNEKKVNNAINQGIIQGESLDKITKRLSKGLAAQNENTMKTFARTAMTGAQNAGRLESMQRAQAKGINVYKQWMATLDSHTRDSHAEVDGESVPLNAKFSNGLEYPGEPGGAPAEVYNCRCTMVSDIKKYPDKYKRYDNIDGKPIENMTYKEWAEAKGYNKKLESIGKRKDNKLVTRQHIDMTLKENYTVHKLDWIIRDTGVNEGEAKTMLSAIQTFTGTGYDWVVEHPDSDQYKNMYDEVERYIEKAPKWNGSVIERGIRMTNVDIDKLKVGQEITQQGRASSWTTDANLARKAATNKLKLNESGVIFHLQPGNRGYLNGTSVAHIAKKPQEKEVVLSGKSSQIIKSITEEQVTKNKRIVHVYVVEG